MQMFEYRISSIRRRTQIVAASFTYRSFIVAALELSPHILIRAHLPRLEAVSTCLRYTSGCTMYIALTVGEWYIKRLVKLLTKADSDKQGQTLS